MSEHDTPPPVCTEEVAIVGSCELRAACVSTYSTKLFFQSASALYWIGWKPPGACWETTRVAPEMLLLETFFFPREMKMKNRNEVMKRHLLSLCPLFPRGQTRLWRHRQPIKVVRLLQLLAVVLIFALRRAPSPWRFKLNRAHRSTFLIQILCIFQVVFWYARYVQEYQHFSQMWLLLVTPT